MGIVNKVCELLIAEFHKKYILLLVTSCYAQKYLEVEKYFVRVWNIFPRKHLLYQTCQNTELLAFSDWSLGY